MSMKVKQRTNPMARPNVAEGSHKQVANEHDESTEIGKNIEALVQAVELRNPSRLRAGLWCCFLLNGVLGDD